jgi:two-component system phosphate regulon sensor histidine kinase PhoR
VTFLTSMHEEWNTAAKSNRHRLTGREARERDLRRVSDFHAALLGMAGHDLRQPLQVILSTHSWLSRRLTAPAERERLEHGAQAIMELIGQLDHLVQALRLHERAGGTRPVPVALEPLLIGIAKEHADQAHYRGIDLRTVPSQLVVMSDEVLLHGILRNLLRNALKYTARGGKVLVGCRPAGPMLRIEVHDTGGGIASDKLVKMFDAFQRCDSPCSDGSGLGLFIVRCAADALGHRMKFGQPTGPARASRSWSRSWLARDLIAGLAVHTSVDVPPS